MMMTSSSDSESGSGGNLGQGDDGRDLGAPGGKEFPHSHPAAPPLACFGGGGSAKESSPSFRFNHHCCSGKEPAFGPLYPADAPQFPSAEGRDRPLAGFSDATSSAKHAFMRGGGPGIGEDPWGMPQPDSFGLDFSARPSLPSVPPVPGIPPWHRPLHPGFHPSAASFGLEPGFPPHPQPLHPPVHFPVKNPSEVPLVVSEEKQACMLCPKRFDMDAERDLFLAHLVMDHNVVIADVKHVPYFPGYVEEWRKMFKHFGVDICPKIKTNYVIEPVGRADGHPDSDPSLVSDHVSPNPSDEAVDGASVAESEDSGVKSDGENHRRGVVGIVNGNEEAERAAENSDSGRSSSAGNGLENGGVVTGDNDDSGAVKTNGVVSAPSPRYPEAGDAPALDAMKQSPRPAPEVEDPAIAAAHPTPPPPPPALSSEVPRGSASTSSTISSSSASSFHCAAAVAAIATANGTAAA